MQMFHREQRYKIQIVKKKETGERKVKCYFSKRTKCIYGKYISNSNLIKEILNGRQSSLESSLHKRLLLLLLPNFTLKITDFLTAIKN